MKELCSALVKAQSEIGAAIKDSTNPHYKSKYADLSSVVSAIKPIAARHGLGFFQRFGSAENGVAVETIIVHESGERLETGLLFVPASKQDAQGYGSAITYARRYSLQTAFGVPSDDDDGHAAAASAPVKRIGALQSTVDGEGIKVGKMALDIASALKGFLADMEAGQDTGYSIYELADPLDQEIKIQVSTLLTPKERNKVKAICAEQREAIKAREPKAA